jgi:hypothetical protein
LQKRRGDQSLKEGIFMKIVSTAYAAALLFGIAACIHSTPALALLPCSSCATLFAECEQGNQTACKAFDAGCQGCPLRSTVSGTPPTNRKIDHGTAKLNSQRAVAVAK